MRHYDRTENLGGVLARQIIHFRGHPMVTSLHPRTIEVTTDEELTPSGDCIIGVGASAGCSNLEAGVKHALRNGKARVKITIRVGGEDFGFSARGDTGLQLTHPHDIVIRKSGYLSERTLAVWSTAAANDLPRSMVARLRDPTARGTLEVEVE